jgi:rhamnulokinase
MENHACEKMGVVNVLAVDIGASSGRCMLGCFDGTKIELSEVHRFTNGPIRMNGTLYCDLLHMIQEIKTGISKIDVPLASIGVDTWGVDFGLIDKTGNLLQNPVNYRDARTTGMPEEIYKKITKLDLYKKTGIQPMQINTIFQIYSLIKTNSNLLTLVDKILFMPDLINYCLTGVKATEYSIASTSSLLDAYEKKWNKDIFSKLGFKEDWFTSEIVPSGTIIGDLLPGICKNSSTALPKVVATASHDTAAAVAAAPISEAYSAYISCGTWSLIGVETDQPMIDKYTYEIMFTNERGVDNTVRLLKNLTGLWVLQECKRYWETKGVAFDYSAMVKTAEEIEEGRVFINLDNPVFLEPGNMQQRIQDYCKNTNQNVPMSKAEIIRCIIDSLACHYKATIDELEKAINHPITHVHIVGGGSKNKLLCQITANITNKVVIAGPAEASSIGNILVQLKALGKIHGMEELRSIVKVSTVIEKYLPQDEDKWNQIYKLFRSVIK